MAYSVAQAEERLKHFPTAFGSGVAVDPDAWHGFHERVRRAADAVSRSPGRPCAGCYVSSADYDSAVPRSEGDIFERAVHTVAEQAAKADALVDEAVAAGLSGSHPVTVQAKMLRLELLNVKADLERELGRLVLNCSDCGQRVHWVPGLGTEAGHWAHREPAPHGSPAV
jgi:hypothetical protein